jgi:hypothetical protein
MRANYCRHFGSVRKLPSRRWQFSSWHNGARHAAPRTFAAKTDAQGTVVCNLDRHKAGFVA